MHVFARAAIEADDMLACVCAYFHTHALVWEDIEVVEVRKEGKEVDVKKVDPPLDTSKRKG